MESVFQTNLTTNELDHNIEIEYLLEILINQILHQENKYLYPKFGTKTD